MRIARLRAFSFLGARLLTSQKMWGKRSFCVYTAGTGCIIIYSSSEGTNFRSSNFINQFSDFLQ